MKKFLSFSILAAAALTMTPAVNAQEADYNYTNISPAKDIYTHSWRDNWYIQLGAGAQMPIFEKNGDASNFQMKKTTALYEAGVGHWFSPYFGFRFRGQGGAMHWENSNQWHKGKYANLNLEITWDMFNSLCGVNDHRVFSIIPYLGVGGSYAWDYSVAGNILDNDGKVMEHQGVVNTNLGLQFRFRCSKRVDLYVDARLTGTADNINNIAWKTGLDPIFSMTGGLQINLGKEGRHVTKYTPFDCMGAINDLNGRINKLRGDLADTEAQLRAAQAQLPCPEVTESAAPAKTTNSVNPAVRFKFNSAKVSANDQVTLYDVAQVLKQDENAKVVLKGYADKRTGTADYNKKLSERRANAVKEALVAYGIDADRIEVEAIGVEEQPYTDNNNWNRVVIVTTK